MPWVGNFSLALIDAHTEDKFKEHCGKKYGYDSFVEVEPGIEYFLSVTNHHSKSVWVEFEVDGEDLDYHVILHPSETEKNNGIWHYNSETNESCTTAIRVCKALASPTKTN